MVAQRLSLLLLVLAVGLAFQVWVYSKWFTFLQQHAGLIQLDLRGLLGLGGKMCALLGAIFYLL